MEKLKGYSNLKEMCKHCQELKARPTLVKKKREKYRVSKLTRHES